ncbi:MAG: glycosyltransferase [Candidatus Auribacterota bacterium]|nr:glycosyltransferase [Candidatus Auribacterota bacterium]
MSYDPLEQNDIFKKNFHAIKHEYPLLAEQIESWISEGNNKEFLKNTLEKSSGQEQITRYSFTEQAVGHPDTVFLYGMGCDFFLTDLARQLQKNTTMFVIEPDLPIFVEAIHLFDISNLIRQWQVKFVIGVPVESFLSNINQYYYPIADYVTIPHPVRFQDNKDYFTSASDKISQFTKKRKPALSNKKQLRFLIFAGTTGVGWPYIMQDVIAALHHIGHKVRLFHLDDSNFIPQLQKELRTHRPDFIIMLDAIGLMPQLFEDEKIPYISWFFDNPFNWLTKKHVSPYYHIFVWDKTYVDDLKKMGFKHVYYLPLGANESVFYPQPSGRQCDISFVGSSLWKLPDLPFENKSKQIFIELISKLLCKTPWIPIWKLIDTIAQQYGTSFTLDDPERRHEFELFVQNYSRTIYRKQIIQAILPFNPWLYGDPDWNNIIAQNGGVYKGRINNRIDLPALYSDTAVNINITVPQLRNSFSHRAFEIPACGGFLLSDYRPAAEEFFKLDSEIVCFKTVGELQEKTTYYLKHSAERKRIADNGRKRVLSEHTYTHRLKNMIESLPV